MSSEYTDEIENASDAQGVFLWKENINIQLKENYQYLMKLHISEFLK